MSTVRIKVTEFQSNVKILYELFVLSIANKSDFKILAEHFSWSLGLVENVLSVYKR